jgi:hypothetical protein
VTEGVAVAVHVTRVGGLMTLGDLEASEDTGRCHPIGAM